MTNFLVYDTASKAHAAEDEIWTLSCGVGVRDDPNEVTRHWASPRQRSIGGWVIEQHPTVAPVVNPPIAVEPFDPEWFTALGAWNLNDKSPAIDIVGAEGRDARNLATPDWGSVRAQRGRSTGKFYFEISHELVGLHADPIVGVADLTNVQLEDGENIGGLANQFGINSAGNFATGITANSVVGLGAAWKTIGTIVGVAVDLDARKLWVAINNTPLAGGIPSSGANPFATWAAPLTLYPAASVWYIGAIDLVRYAGDASDQGFAPPMGFTAWDLE